MTYSPLTDYAGSILIGVFPNNVVDYREAFNSVLQVLSNHTHDGTTTGGAKLNAATSLQALSITGALIQDGTISSSKLAAATSFSTIANDTYLLFRNFDDNADIDGLKLNVSDHLEFDPDIDKLRMAHDVEFGGAESGGGTLALFKVNTSNQWEFSNTFYSRNMLFVASDTYDIGSASSVARRVYANSIYGNTLFPTRSAFFAHRTSAASNVTGDGTTYTIVFDAELMDVNSDFNTSDGLFTAPVSGVYHFSGAIGAGGTDSKSHLIADFIITLSAGGSRILRFAQIDPADHEFWSGGGSIVVALAAGDTVGMRLTVAGGSKNVSIGETMASTYLNYFSGCLLG